MESSLEDLIEKIEKIDQVIGIGYGGSRGLKLHNENSDFDIVIYHNEQKPLNFTSMKNYLDPLFEGEKLKLIGNFITGEYKGKKFEIFQKKIIAVNLEINQSKEGKFRYMLRKLFPHGYLSTSLLSHIVYLDLIVDKKETIKTIRNSISIYPKKLMISLLNYFFREAQITLIHAKKINNVQHVFNLTSLISFFFFYIDIVIFTVNNQYPVLEKGGLLLLNNFQYKISDYENLKKAIYIAALNLEFDKSKNLMSEIEKEIQSLMKISTTNYKGPA